MPPYALQRASTEVVAVEVPTLAGDAHEALTCLPGFLFLCYYMRASLEGWRVCVLFVDFAGWRTGANAEGYRIVDSVAILLRIVTGAQYVEFDGSQYRNLIMRRGLGSGLIYTCRCAWISSPG